MKNKTIVALVVLAGFLVFSGFQGNSAENDLIRAKATLQQIFSLYNSGHHHLLNETYPYKQDNKASYLAGDDTLTGRRVAYLWPTSGVFSGVNALLKTTGNKQYRQLLETDVLPGLKQYFDSVRKPACYQSYIVSAGKSDRFYDDNVWLSLDFCESYMLTKKPEYLKKSIETWQFVLSGWDEQLGGGIYWCEQKKQSKNTGNWFNAILFRGYTELYRLDGNAEYTGIFRDNMDQLWNYIRDKNGLFSKDWKGQKDDPYKWLLDQASLVEIWGTLAEMK